MLLLPRNIGNIVYVLSERYAYKYSFYKGYNIFSAFKYRMEAEKNNLCKPIDFSEKK